MTEDITILKVNMAELKTDVKYIKSSLIENAEQHKQILERMESHWNALEDSFCERYVTKDAFSPVQKIAYGLLGAISLAVIYAILNLVLK